MNPFIAFLGGVLTLCAPCSVMLLPAFFSYAFRSPSQLIARCGIFWLGLMTPLIPLGIALSGVVALIREHASLITHVVAFLVICAGIITIAALDFPKFHFGSPRPAPTRPGTKLTLSTPLQLASSALARPRHLNFLFPPPARTREKRAPPSRFIFWGLPTGSRASDARGPF